MGERKKSHAKPSVPPQVNAAIQAVSDATVEKMVVLDAMYRPEEMEIVNNYIKQLIDKAVIKKNPATALARVEIDKKFIYTALNLLIVMGLRTAREGLKAVENIRQAAVSTQVTTALRAAVTGKNGAIEVLAEVERRTQTEAREAKAKLNAMFDDALAHTNPVSALSRERHEIIGDVVIVHSDSASLPENSLLSMGREILIKGLKAANEKGRLR